MALELASNGDASQLRWLPLLTCIQQQKYRFELLCKMYSSLLLTLQVIRAYIHSGCWDYMIVLLLHFHNTGYACINTCMFRSQIIIAKYAPFDLNNTYIPQAWAWDNSITLLHKITRYQGLDVTVSISMSEISDLRKGYNIIKSCVVVKP